MVVVASVITVHRFFKRDYHAGGSVRPHTVSSVEWTGHNAWNIQLKTNAVVKDTVTEDAKMTEQEIFNDKYLSNRERSWI